VETLTITLDDEIARRAAELARREQKSISEWVAGRIKSDVDQGSALTSIPSRETANGYPSQWLALVGALADDDAFVAPGRSLPRSVGGRST